jgi:AraC-like DNA-binding protein
MWSSSAESDPHPALTGLVQKYSGSALSGFSTGLHIGTPGLTLPLILTLRDHPVTLATTTPRNGDGKYQQHSSVVAGLQVSPTLIAHGATSHTLTVHLTPSGSRRLLGLPAMELTGRAVAAEDILGSSVEDLRQRLELSDDWPTRFELVDAYLRARVRDENIHHGLAGAAWESIIGSQGRRNVTAVAEHLRCSRRTLYTALTSEVGLSPKVLARIVRFNTARPLLHERLLRHQPTPTLAQIAAQCGYADEAHLIREWSSFTRTTPTTWRSHDEFAFHQAH